MKKIWKRAAALAMAVLTAGSVPGCGQGNRLAAGVNTDNAIVTSMSTESGSLDSAGDSSLWWWSYDDVCMAPLMEMEEDGSWNYILAESVDVSDDMTRYTVHIREEAKWNNGDDVTSADFLNTITRALDPECQSGYSSMLFVIQGAQEMYNC